MTLNEAIESISRKIKYEYSASKTEEGDAVKLLMEAGKRLLITRQYYPPSASHLLPGETPEPASP